ncbi:MAG: hypothetical protein ACREBG_16180 [Pyrinomonadaceae bacterium]
MIKTILVLGTVVAGVAALIVTGLWLTHPTTDIEQQRLYFDAFKAIGIGFLVALLGTLIPNLILESRDNFERAKQSRMAYSHAKTSVIYLPGTLAVLKYGDAMGALQEAHRKLHIAETYGKELGEYLKWYGDKGTWTDQTYWELTAVRILLQSRADEWENLSPGERTLIVDHALLLIRDLFGPKGKEWKQLPTKEREAKAEELVAKISGHATVT